MKKLIVVSMVSSLFLAACGAETEDVSLTDDVGEQVVSEDASNKLVPFSEVNMNMLSASKPSKDSDEGYEQFHFLEGTGLCVDKGFPAEFAYKFDYDLGYKIFESLDGSLRDEWVGMGANGVLNLIDKGVVLDGVEGEVSCSVKSTTGEDDATFKCEVVKAVDGEEVREDVCEAAYKVYALK